MSLISKSACAGLIAKGYLSRFKGSIAHCIQGLFADVLRDVRGAVSAHALPSAQLEEILSKVTLPKKKVYSVAYLLCPSSRNSATARGFPGGTPALAANPVQFCLRRQQTFVISS